MPSQIRASCSGESVSVSYSNFPSLAYLEIRVRRDASGFLSLVSIEKGISGVEKGFGSMPAYSSGPGKKGEIRHWVDVQWGSWAPTSLRHQPLGPLILPAICCTVSFGTGDPVQLHVIISFKIKSEHFGWLRWEDHLRLEVQNQLGQHSETVPISTKNKKKTS